MTDVILRTATRFLITIMLLFSVFLFLRGHDQPGGGFVGGLVAAGALALYAIAYDLETARRIVYVEPRFLAGFGLALAAISGLPALFLGQSFMNAQWVKLDIFGVYLLKLGTPTLFDLGVFMTVVGATLMIFLSLAEE